MYDKEVPPSIADLVRYVSFLMLAARITERHVEPEVRLKSLEQLRQPHEIADSPSCCRRVINDQSRRDALDVEENVR
ncbi:hypothetical protein C7445_1142 [Alicyclobacillus sacchari]|uniref:Uncharacterized protein n=1 Tax=Alicyclobacillus sacchari TaxID=392010 RepID=A0A4R8LHA3_9BACL|nr:hypothetical protein [Alicyclobacillus sacchari]TDY42569.1 hypothetical protein C7445_1142 [Alicyclobacillus sacchari]GMA58104.1 hypothetical protein GCM10025858_26070 [Alicyclobacillus sacchari]